MTTKRHPHSPVHIPPGQERTSYADRVDALRRGVELPVTLGDVMDVRVGSTPGPEVRAVSRLATAMHRAESDEWSISWSAQEKARAYYNAHGLAASLSEAARLESGKAST